MKESAVGKLSIKLFSTHYQHLKHKYHGVISKFVLIEVSNV